jgi:drug/metabolite transporter (DMT)-like permease
MWKVTVPDRVHQKQGERPSYTKIALILISGAAFGSSVVMSRVGLSEIPPLWLVTMRLTLSSLVMVLVMIFQKRRLPAARRVWVDIGLVALGNVLLSMMSFTFALQYLSSGVLTIILALIPLFTSLMAHIWLIQEKLHLTKLAGLGLAFLGVVVLLSTKTSGLAETPTAGFQGYFLAITGVIVSSAAVVYARRRLRDVDVMVLTGGQMAFSLLVLIPFALAFSDLEISSITWRGWMAVGYNGLVGSFLGHLIFFKMVKSYGATAASLSSYVIPVVSTGLGVAFLGEIVTLPLGIGAVLVLLGVFWAERKSTAKAF